MKKQLKEELIALANKIIQIKEEDEIQAGELKRLSLQLYDKLTVLEVAEKFISSTASEMEGQTNKDSDQFSKNSPDDLEEIQALDNHEGSEKNAVTLKPKQQLALGDEFEEEPETTSPEKEEAKGDIVESSTEPETEPEKEEYPGSETANNHKEEPKEQEHDEYAPDGTLFNDSEGLTEPNTEKIKDIVAQMPPETQELDDMLEYLLPKDEKDGAEDFGGVSYDQLPQFEPVQVKKEQEKPKSLNDRLRKGINIGVNDRHAFVRHLFDGSTADYNRVLSQLNTLKSKKEAFEFVLNMVKPDYNNWEGKEEYEARFLALIENRFE